MKIITKMSAEDVNITHQKQVKEGVVVNIIQVNGQMKRDVMEENMSLLMVILQDVFLHHLCVIV